MYTLIDILHREHASMRDLLTVMENEILRKSAADLDLLMDIFSYCESYPDGYHHPKEDLLFQVLCQQTPEAVAELDDLEKEHRKMATATKEIVSLLGRALNNDAEAKMALPNTIEAYVRFYRGHMTREEKAFFPLAQETLSEESWMELESHVSNPTDPFFAEKARSLIRAFSERAT